MIEKVFIWAKAISTLVVQKFDSFMPNLNYQRSKFDSCVYTKQLTNNFFIYLLLYVNDMLIATKDMSDQQVEKSVEQRV